MKQLKVQQNKVLNLSINYKVQQTSYTGLVLLCTFEREVHFKGSVLPICPKCWIEFDNQTIILFTFQAEIPRIC